MGKPLTEQKTIIILTLNMPPIKAQLMLTQVLNQKQIDTWNIYQETVKNNLKKKAHILLSEFIDSFESEEQKNMFTLELVKYVYSNSMNKRYYTTYSSKNIIVIQYPLFEKIIYPNLISGFNRGDIYYGNYIVFFDQFIYGNEIFRSKFFHNTGLVFDTENILQNEISKHPDNIDAIKMLIDLKKRKVISLEEYGEASLSTRKSLEKEITLLAS